MTTYELSAALDDVSDFVFSSRVELYSSGNMDIVVSRVDALREELGKKREEDNGNAYVESFCLSA
jgi:hypothetical protein